MPDRQSSSGEVTMRPEPGSRAATADAHATNGASSANGSVTPTRPRPLVEPLTEQVAAQVAAQPEAVAPARARPGDGTPTAGPVVDGDAAVEVTVETVAAGRPAGGGRTGAAASAESDTAEVAAAGDRSGAVQPAAVPAAAPPRPADEPSSDAEPSGAVAGATGDESPTVAVRRPAGGPPAWFGAPDAEQTQLLPGGPLAAAAPADTPTERIRLRPTTEQAPVETVVAQPLTQPPVTSPPVTQQAVTQQAVTQQAVTQQAVTQQAVTQQQAVTPPTPPPPDVSSPEPEAERPPPRKARRRLLVVAGTVAVLGLAYGADLLFSAGSVPRGTTVAGVSVGGLSLADAEKTLRTQIEPRTTEPVAVTVGEARSRLDPRVAGLAVDWSATLDRAGAQPLNPITRVTSFFDSREVGIATSTDRPALEGALAQLAPIVNKAPVEGTVKFEGVTPVPVDPVPGQELDAPGAASVLERDWLSGAGVALPLTTLPAVTTPDDVAAAIAKVAAPAVAAPVTVLGENGARGALAPAVIATALTFRADPTGLVPEINTGAVTDALTPQLAASEKPGRDAKLDFSSGTPVVVPSQDGRGIDYPATLKDLLPVLTGTDKREITAVYADQPATLTTEQLTALSINGVIGEFQTGGFAADSGRNIKRAAEQINGAIVQPGETFSLNARTNPRDAAHGYVEAGIIENGHSARGIGGGVSQVATTLYNAAYFAGMTNVEHKEHSFYISRYPAGREATVFDDIIDLKFRNDNPTAVMIQTTWTPSSLNVRIVGTKVWEVASASGPRTSPTNPTPITIPAGEHCTPSRGAPGFTITNTRTLKNVQSGAVRTDPTRTVKYNPSPIVICGA